MTSNPLETYIKHTEKDISWNVFQNPNFRLHFIKKYIYKKWNWKGVSSFINETYFLELKDVIEINWENLSRNKNISLEFIEKNLNFPWNWKAVSLNPNLTLSFVVKYKNFDWDWGYIVINSSFLTKDIEDFIDMFWESFETENNIWRFISQNTNLSLKYLEKLISKKGGILNYEWLSTNKNLTIDFVKAHPTVNSASFWEPYCILKNEAIDLRQIENHFDLVLKYWKYLSMNPNITVYFIEKYIDNDWNFTELSIHPNLTIDLVAKYRNKPWKWEYISSHNSATFEKIKQYSDLNWKWKYVSQNKNITLEMIEYFIDKDWDWGILGYKSVITFEFFRKHKEKKWNPQCIASNPNFLVSDITEYSEDVNWRGISINPNITSEDIKKHCDKPYWEEKIMCSLNDFLYNDVVFKKNIKSDIKIRRNSFLNLKMFGDIDKVINFYIGYF
jgi:hypothetical protein